MSAASGARIDRTNLLSLHDFGSKLSFASRAGIADHGISNWYCREGNGVELATYSAIYPYTTIFYITNTGTVGVLLKTGSEPQRGTFAPITDYQYFGSKPIHLMMPYDGASQHKLLPTSLAGKQFGGYSNRYGQSEYMLLSLFNDATVDVYDNVVGGVGSGTPSSSISLTKGVKQFYTTTTENAWVFFDSNYPIIMSAFEAQPGDSFVMSPMENTVYVRRSGTRTTINGTAPTTAGFAVADSIPCASIEIGDGAGGDAAGHLGASYLSDTYSWGEKLSDYRIVSPHASNTINVSYYSGGQWNLLESHVLSGTELAPGHAFREGTTGPGVDGNTALDDGTAIYFAASANLWKFEGDLPFLVAINDVSDDEETLLGWMKDDIVRGADHADTVVENGGGASTYDISLLGFSELNNTPVFGTDGKRGLFTTPYNNTVTGITWNLWVKGTKSSDWAYILHNNGTTTTVADSHVTIGIESGGKYVAAFNGAWTGMVSTVDASSSVWRMITLTWDSTEQLQKIYVDGALENSSGLGIIDSTNAIHTTTSLGTNQAGSTRPFSGEISHVECYTRALSQTEIRKNFNALRGRFGV